MEYRRIRFVGPVPCMGEKYTQSCGGENRTIILGRHRRKCVIILKWKE